jgi:hypothetical protein
MHILVLPDRGSAKEANSVLNDPQHNSVTIPGSVGVRGGLESSEANFSKSSLYKRTRSGNENIGAANLAHGSGDKVAEDEVNIDVVARKLRSKGNTPVLEEGLAARVGGEKGSRRPTTKGAHGQDEAGLALLQDRGNDLGNLERTQAVDRDDILELTLGSFEEGDGDAVALANIIDQNTNIKGLHKLFESCVVGLVVLGEVHGKSLDIDALSDKSVFNIRS